MALGFVSSAAPSTNVVLLLQLLGVNKCVACGTEDVSRVDQRARQQYLQRQLLEKAAWNMCVDAVGSCHLVKLMVGQLLLLRLNVSRCCSPICFLSYPLAVTATLRPMHHALCSTYMLLLGKPSHY